MKPRQDPLATFTIRAYDHESLTTNQQKLALPIALHSRKGVIDMPEQTLASLDQNWITEQIKQHPNTGLILVDSGEQQQWLDPLLVSLCHSHRVAIEALTSPAIYRQFSLLANDQIEVLGLFFTQKNMGNL